MNRDEERIGTVVDGRFEIDCVIGRGAHGVVYRAKQRAVDRAVAIKILSGADAKDPELRARFKSEATAIARLGSAHTVSLYDFGRLADGAFFIAMELVEGEDLGALIEREGRLDAGRAVDLFKGIAASLAEAHELGIVHRDIKPANVIVQTRDGVARVVDFGISKLMDNGVQWTRKEDLLGTPAYMAPEQWAVERGSVGPRTDIYALGVLLFESLTGRLPFEAESPAEFMHAHLESRPPGLPSDVADHRRLERVIERCLMKRPSDRFGSAQEFAQALEVDVAPSRRPVLVAAGLAALVTVAVAVQAMSSGAAPSMPEPPPDDTTPVGTVERPAERAPVRHRPLNVGLVDVIGLDESDCGDVRPARVRRAEALRARTRWFPRCSTDGVGSRRDLDGSRQTTRSDIRELHVESARHGTSCAAVRSVCGRHGASETLTTKEDRTMTESSMIRLDKDTLKKRRLQSERRTGVTMVVARTPDRAHTDRRLELDGRPRLIGRAADDVQIEDPRLSKVHFKVTCKDDGCLITDCETTNGTFVDGRRVVEPTPLAPHSVVSAGDTLFIAEAEPDADTLPAAVRVEGEAPTTLVGKSLAIERLRRSIQTVASGDDPVLLLGETGVGKEVAAEAIHDASGRDGPWIAVNCAAIPRDLADSMLFGHARGAFTGAHEAHRGFFSKADGGTLFLDEIGELPNAVQAKLLRVLETGLVDVLGGEPRMVDVRIISATHRTVSDADAFRSDLYGRLSDWVLQIPPLRERRADILPLFFHFASIEAGGAVVEASPEFAEALVLHDWPQNVRELSKLAKRVVKLYSADEPLDLYMLPVALSDSITQREERRGERGVVKLTSADDRVSEVAPTRGEMLAMIRHAKGNVQAVARENQWHRMQVYRWVKRYGINPAEFR